MKWQREPEIVVAFAILAAVCYHVDAADCKRECGEFTQWRVCLKPSGLTGCTEFAIYWRGKESKSTFAYLDACCDPDPKYDECKGKLARTKVQVNVNVKLCATCTKWCPLQGLLCVDLDTQTVNNANMCDNDETMDRYKCYDPYE